MTQRRICWPTFDRVCLMGGCLYCNDNPYRAVTEIRAAIEPWDEERWQAFYDGKDNDWRNAEVKR